MSLDFQKLRAANVGRCREVYHPLDQWSPCDWATALGGETGEALNEVKKLRRLDDHPDHSEVAESQQKLKIGMELADVVIYADLLAARLGLSLEHCIVLKFNKVSEEKDSRFRL